MKLIAMMNGDEPVDFDAPEPAPIEVVFNGVKEYSFTDSFFVVIKENGEHFAIKTYKIESFKLIND